LRRAADRVAGGAAGRPLGARRAAAGPQGDGHANAGRAPGRPGQAPPGDQGVGARPGARPRPPADAGARGLRRGQDGRPGWVWVAVAAAVALLAGAFVVVRRLRRPRSGGARRWKLPELLTPFTALGLLERIRQEGGLSETQRAELGQALRLLERHYFAAGGNG